MIPAKLQFTALRFWHAWLAGGFVVAWATADEDTYAMHQFAGYAVLAAIVLRLLVGLMAGKGSPWRLPRPRLTWTNKGRSPLFAWFAALLLGVIGLAALLGALADGATWLEDPHQAVSTLSLWVIGGHAAFIAFFFGGKRLLARLSQNLLPKEKTT
ncbi:MAG: hypothetical protein HYU59_08685 [Magnetospirillum gryphiswaldense]|nr:hypothetical protein [Magnetospirillum gryphiswaldense]